MASSIITEDHVSANILSFTRQNFLFTRTVCKSWYENGKGTETHVHRSVDSISTIDEAYEFPDEFPHNLFAPFLHAIDNGSDISVFEYLVDIGANWDGDRVAADEASRCGRIDVLRLFQKNGLVLDKEILHTAVRYGQLDTLVYLMNEGCPVDDTRVDWGYGPNVVEELKMCSMEMAARDGRLDIMKQLRTTVLPSTPFPHETVEYALEGKDLDVLKYLRDECAHDVFQWCLFEAISNGDLYTVELLVNNDLVKDIFPTLLYAFGIGNTDMVDYIVINTTMSAREGVFERALCSFKSHGVCLAHYLVCEHGMTATPDAYNCLLHSECGEVSLLNVFNWLYDDLRIRVNPECLTNLANHSEKVQRWFHCRCRSCRINFKDGNNGVKRKWGT